LEVASKFQQLKKDNLFTDKLKALKSIYSIVRTSAGKCVNIAAVHEGFQGAPLAACGLLFEKTVRLENMLKITNLGKDVVGVIALPPLNYQSPIRDFGSLYFRHHYLSMTMAYFSTTY